MKSSTTVSKLALFLIIFGLLLLFRGYPVADMTFFRFITDFWPLILIAVGVRLLLRR